MVGKKKLSDKGLQKLKTKNLKLFPEFAMYVFGSVHGLSDTPIADRKSQIANCCRQKQEFDCVQKAVCL